MVWWFVRSFCVVGEKEGGRNWRSIEGGRKKGRRKKGGRKKGGEKKGGRKKGGRAGLTFRGRRCFCVGVLESGISYLWILYSVIN